MNTEHSGWSSIESFAHVLREYRKHAEKIAYDGPATVAYRAKVKLHGTNAAIQIRGGKVVGAQARTHILNYPFEDNAGFASWAIKTLKPAWEAVDQTPMDFNIHGEWVGPGIQKGVACSKTPNKWFAVFAVEIEVDGQRHWDADPGTIENFVHPAANRADFKIIPWDDGLGFLVDFDKTDHGGFGMVISPEAFVSGVNAMVEACERCDPFVKEAFGIEGVGEGYVFYPVRSDIAFIRSGSSRLMFKAKGEGHRVVKEPKAASTQVVTDPRAKVLAQKLVTGARIKQAITEVTNDNGVTMRDIGRILKWVNADLMKECGPEITDSGLEWKQLVPHVNKLVVDHVKALANDLSPVGG